MCIRDSGRHRYVGVMVNFTEGWKTLGFYAKYLGAIRWLFHGQFSGQDAWMVDVTDAPPERLYRPDVSLTAWRKLAEEESERKIASVGLAPGEGEDHDEQNGARTARRGADHGGRTRAVPPGPAAE